MVADLSRAGRIEHLLPDLPSPLVPTYSALIEAEVSEILARRIVRDVADRLDPDELHRPAAIRSATSEAIGDSLAIAPPSAAVAGARRVVALVGPTGVGKTTTVAKLAADFKLVKGLRPGLVTVDTYRIAAVEQLRTYAEIIDLPLAVANSPAEMRRAIEGLGDVDLVLIDTAGRSPRDEVKIRELAEFLAAAGPDEVHLVLSAAGGEKSLRSAVERFATVHADRLILTKLDEAEGLGEHLLGGRHGRSTGQLHHHRPGRARRHGVRAGPGSFWGMTVSGLSWDRAGSAHRPGWQMGGGAHPTRGSSTEETLGERAMRWAWALLIAGLLYPGCAMPAKTDDDAQRKPRRKHSTHLPRF